jgi:hypothetical protein
MNEGQMEQSETERDSYIPDKFQNIYHAFLVLQRTLKHINLIPILN